MYTNDTNNITNNIKSNLSSGDKEFTFYFVEQTMGHDILDAILQGFYAIDLPDNLIINFYFSRSNMHDDSGSFFINKLATVNWPNKINITLLLDSNFISDEVAKMFIDFCSKFNKLPETNILVNLENNNALTCSIIETTLTQIENSKIIGDAIVNEYSNIEIEFSHHLIQEYLTGEIQNDVE